VGNRLDGWLRVGLWALDLLESAHGAGRGGDSGFRGASFFFALAETRSFPSANGQVAQLAEKKPRAGKVVAALLEHPQDLLATLALGNTFANAAMLAVALRMVFNADDWTLALTMIALLALTLLGCRSFPQDPGGAAAGTLGRSRVSWPLLVISKGDRAAASRSTLAERGDSEKDPRRKWPPRRC